jgi:hypothetical protein
LSSKHLLSAVTLLGLLGAAPTARADDGAYLLPHPDARWWLSGQINVIGQAHGRFSSAYEGPHSLHHGREGKVSEVITVFGALAITRSTELLVDGESAGGDGLSSALGMAGFPNIDVVRNPSLGRAPYLARAVIHQVIALSDDRVAVERGPMRAFATLPARRIELRAGRMSTVDAFDLNDVGSDSHLQFANWTVDNNGAYDYAADTRGYTLGGIVEYQEPRWGARVGEMLMPTVANGIDYEFDVAHARGEQVEGEVRIWPGGRPGTVRGLVFWNHAKMGSYAQANAAARATGAAPVIEESRAQARTKLGFGLNAEQEVADDARVFGRVGWNDGENESFAYTEVDNTVAVGGEVEGGRWRRPHDQVGLAVVSNGLSRGHRDYLALGGQGFLLGDGGLRYGRETIVEGYYTVRAYRGVSPAVDVQVVERPGYNTARGPVVVAGLRLHVDL